LKEKGKNGEEENKQNALKEQRKNVEEEKK
jgi:hypothetical protein